MCSLFAAAIAAALTATPPKPASPTEPTLAETRAMLGRALAFLADDAVAWRTDRKCVTCHHGLMTVWALGEARARGYTVDPKSWTDLTRWVIGDDGEVLRTRVIPLPPKAGDPPPPYHVVSLQALLFAQAAPALSRDLNVAARKELDRLPAHVAEHQKGDGSFSAEDFPAGNRPPPTQESPEVLTLWAYLALESFVPDDPGKPSPARSTREKAAAWLGRITPGDSTQVSALRLVADARAGRSAETLRPGVDRLIGRQNPDGGWSQVKGLASDAYATGQALYALSEARVPTDRPEVRRAIAFLLAQQQDDGSWQVTPRAHPGAKPFKDDTAISYFGTAWATLGLLRSLPLGGP